MHQTAQHLPQARVFRCCPWPRHLARTDDGDHLRASNVQPKLYQQPTLKLIEPRLLHCLDLRGDHRPCDVSGDSSLLPAGGSLHPAQQSGGRTGGSALIEGKYARRRPPPLHAFCHGEVALLDPPMPYRARREDLRREGSLRVDRGSTRRCPESLVRGLVLDELQLNRVADANGRDPTKWWRCTRTLLRCQWLHNRLGNATPQSRTDVVCALMPPRQNTAQLAADLLAAHNTGIAHHLSLQDLICRPPTALEVGCRTLLAYSQTRFL